MIDFVGPYFSELKFVTVLIPLTSKTAPEGTTWFNKFYERHASKQRNTQILPEIDTADEDKNQINNEKRQSETDL